MAKIKSDWGNFLLILAGPLIIPLFWWILWDWSPSKIVFAGDGLMHIPWYRIILENNGNWDQLQYMPHVFGGAAFIDAWERIPLIQFISRFTSNPIIAQHFIFSLLQFSIGFFGLSIARSLAHEFNIQIGRIEKLILFLVLCFSPSICIRLTEGHNNLIWGMLFSIIPLAIFLEGARLRPSSLLMSFFIWPSTVLSSGHQTKIYGMAILGPLIAYTIFRNFKNFDKRQNWLILFYFMSLFLWCLGDLLAMINFASGMDTPRSIASSIKLNLTPYKINLWTYLSLFTSDFSYWRAFGSRVLPHENFYPLGAFWIGLLFLDRKKSVLRCIFLSVILSLLLPILIQFSDLQSLPLLKNFRIPQRSILFAVFFLTILGTLGILKWRKNTIWDFSIIGFLILFFTLTPVLRAPLLMLVVAGTLLLSRLKNNYLQIGSALVFCLIGLNQFNVLANYHSAKVFSEPLVEKPALVSKKIKNQYPFLSNNLNRVLFLRRHPISGANTAAMLSISSTDGYWLPTDRFLKLLTAVTGEEHSNSINHLNFDKEYPKYSLLKNLYNQREVEITDEGDFKFHGDRKWQPYWFSQEVWQGESLTLVPQVDENNFSEKQIVDKELKLPTQIGDCNHAVASQFTSTYDNIQFQANQLKNCPLTIATNYLTNMRASYKNGDEIQIYPAYHALTGLWLTRPGMVTISFSSRNPLPISLKYFAIILALFLLAALFFFSPTTNTEAAS